MTLQTQRVQPLEQVHRVAEAKKQAVFALAERASACEFIAHTLVQIDCWALGKADKGAVKAYLVNQLAMAMNCCPALVEYIEARG